MSLNERPAEKYLTDHFKMGWYWTTNPDGTREKTWQVMYFMKQPTETASRKNLEVILQRKAQAREAENRILRLEQKNLEDRSKCAMYSMQKNL